ncbi:MAG TPA: alpha/beta fold hydrolase [Usitatibacter sp.]|nr:alpha/beta fold hydrolase [Usitatibacter sp.]
MTDRQHIRFCTSSDGVSLAHATLGHGTPLVKAANWLTHLEHDWQSPIWRHWVLGLSRHHAYTRYDTRGCGLSEREPADFSFESWVRDLEAVVDANKLERFSLLGISQGGPIAIAYAVRHPERVSHLVLYGAFARGRLKRGAQSIEEAMLYYKLVELGWGTDAAAFREVFAREFLPDGSPETIQAFDELQRVSASGAKAVRMMQVSDQIDVSELAPRLACPTLVLHGRGDRRVAFEEGRRLAALIPNARFVPLESHNHVLLESEPAWPAFLGALESFLPGATPGAFGDLTARERQLLDLLARGLDNHQIAAHLELAEKTVRNHVSAIFTKLGVDNRARAVVRAREAGFGS